MSKQAYVTSLETKTDIETLKSIVKLYLASYELNYGVRVRPKLVDALVVYMRDGVSKESDELISDMYNLKLANIRVHKNELRKLGLLKKSKYRNRIEVLNEDLVNLINLFNETKDTNNFIYCFTFKNLNSVNG